MLNTTGTPSIYAGTACINQLMAGLLAAGSGDCVSINMTTMVTGTLPAANGGTSVNTAPDDNILIGSGSAWVRTALPDCTDTGGNHLNYTLTTNAVSCGTSGGAGSGDVTAAATFGTDNVLIKSDGTGKGVQSTGITVADTTHDISGAASMQFGSDPADAGRVRLSNNESLCWEAAIPGTDLCMTLNASDEFTLNAPLNITGTSGPFLMTGVTSPSAPATAEQWYFYADSVDNLPKYIYNGETEQTFYTTANAQTTITGNAGTATALAANPTDCSANQFSNAIAASGNLTCGAIADADVPDTITASNYLPLAGGTLTGSLITDNLGIDFDDSDINPTCVAGDYKIYADLSETKLKKCMNGSATDLDTTGGTPSFDSITGGTNTTAAMVVGTGGSLAVSGSGTIAASTAAALAANGSNCTGEVALGVSASGVCEGTATPTLGTAGSVVGTVAFANATSGTITISPPTGALGTVTVSLPAATDTLMGKATTDVVTNKTFDAEASGNVLTIPRRLWFPAAGVNNVTAGAIWDLPPTSPAVAAYRTGTNTTKGFLDFANGSSLTASLVYMLPATWVGAVEARVYWQNSSATLTGDVVWQIAIACAGDGDSDDPAYTDDVFTADTVKGTADLLNMTASNTVTTTGTCAADDLAHIRIKRDSAHASDTFAATARLIGVELVIREAL